MEGFKPSLQYIGRIKWISLIDENINEFYGLKSMEAKSIMQETSITKLNHLGTVQKDVMLA